MLARQACLVWAIDKAKEKKLPALVGYAGVVSALEWAYISRGRCQQALEELEEQYARDSQIAGKCGMDTLAQIERGWIYLRSRSSAEYWVKHAGTSAAWLKRMAKVDSLDFKERKRGRGKKVSRVGGSKASTVLVRS